MNSSYREQVAKEFGSFIREAREKRGLLQADVAERANISRGYYAHIENGNREIYFALAMTLCGVVGADLNDFVKIMMK